jgi:AcrR family transcriptional regulator
MSVPPTSAAHAPKPLRADARRNRERIVEAARKVFAEGGSEAQVDDIARAAGVGVGTVYRHFPHKDALMAELVTAKFRGFADNAERALDVADPWEAFAGLLRANAAVCARDLAVQQALAREPSAWAAAEDEFQRLRTVTAQLIRRAQDAGAMRADFTVDEIPMLVCGLSATMGVAGYDWRRHLDILLDGLRARPGATGVGIQVTP